MPAFKPPKSLVDSSINALCRIVFSMLKTAVAVSKKTDAALHLIENQIEAFLKKMPSKSVDPAQKRIDLLNVGKMIKSFENITVPFLTYMDGLPFEFRNRIFIEVLNDLDSAIDSYDDVFEIEEIENSLTLKWNFPSRIKFMFLVLVKCLFFDKTTYIFNINTLTDGYFSFMKEYILNNEFYKNDDYMAEVQKMNHRIFASTFITFSGGFSFLTEISMRHLASGTLLWNICCNCPNLWHLDLSGEMFDLQRYSVYEAAAGEFVNALTSSGKRQFKEADFVEALCGLHGNNGENHKKFDGIAEGCYYLRTLLLPNYNWEAREEAIMVEEMLKIFEQLLYLEEVSGVCLYNVLCKLNESTNGRPLMLKLKKFDGTAGGHRLVAVDPKRLNKVKLPCVEEVIFIANVVMKPSTLQELFPNLKHLTITPYDSRAFTFHSILPHLGNLVSLDIEFLHSISLENVCELSKQCCSLKYLSITCPALLDESHVANGMENIAEKYRKVSPFHLRADKERKCEPPEKDQMYEYDYCRDTIYSYLTNLKALQESGSSKYKTDGVIPKFSKLLKLQFFGLKYLDEDSLYQIILGTPFLQAFTLVLTLGPNSMIQISNAFIGRLAPHLPRVRDVIIAADKPNEDYYLELDGESIAHLVYFCQDIRSISRVVDWDINQSQWRSLAYFMQCENYVLKIH